MEPNNNHQSQNPIPLYRQSTDYLLDHLCTSFGPHKQYFLKHPPMMLRKGQPKYEPSISKCHRNNLGEDRQIKYLRRAVSNDICPEVVKEGLRQKFYEPYRRRGNVSAVWNGWLFWVEESTLKKMRINSVVQYIEGGSAPSVLPSEMTQFPTNELIYQLKISGELLLLRSARQIFLYDLAKSEPVNRFKFDCQIVALWDYVTKISHLLFVTLFDGQFSVVQMLDLKANQPKFFKIRGQIPDVVHAGWTLTKNQQVLCKQNSVDLYDRRANTIVSLYKTNEKTIILTGMPVNGVTSAYGTFVLSEYLKIKVFDIRKPKSEIYSIKHYCEEAPPTILQHYQTKNDKLNFAIAHNPYKNGSALLVNLEPNPIKKPPTLLYDSGKLNKNLHPSSISFIQTKNGLALFHLDSQGGINLELMHEITKATKSNKQNLLDPIFERVPFVGPNVGLQDTNYQWFRNKNVNKMIKNNTVSFWDSQIQEDQELMLEENSPEKRYIRYCDLRNFYACLVKKADQKSLNQAILMEKQALMQSFKQSNKIEMSLGSTLPNFSQNQWEDGGSVDTDLLRTGQLMQLNELWDSD